jgi:hypothetical protein
MRNSLKQTLLAGVAGAALAIGFAVSPASAFDRSFWTFDLRVDPCVDITVHLDPTSMTTVEIDQDSIGDITAVSVVKDITINNPGGSSNYWCFSWNTTPALDATTQLGSLSSVATAVANNASINTETVATFIDSSQFASGGYFGGDVTAKSIVKDIKNLSIDSQATAVANNLNIQGPSTVVAGQTNLVANVDQKNLMDVSAISVVKDVTLSNYKNLGQLSGPVINSAATAVGNNLNVTVGIPK